MAALSKITKPQELGIVARKLIRPTSFDDFQINFKMLIFGPPGIGKTLLAASANEVEELSPCLYINIEGGDTSILMTDRFVPNLWSIPFPDFRASNLIYDLLTTYISVRDKLKVFKSNGNKEGEQVILKVLAEKNATFGLPADFLPKSVIFDTITEMHKRIMDFIDGIDSCSKEVRDFEPEMSQIQDWGKASSATENFLRALRDLDISIFLIAQDQLFKDDTSGAVTIMPELPGKLPGKISAYFDIQAYYTMEKDTRLLLTQPKGRVRAKDRTNSFGAGVLNPTMKKLWDIYYDHKKKLFEATGNIEEPKKINNVPLKGTLK